jgi:hypothetical protein
VPGRATLTAVAVQEPEDIPPSAPQLRRPSAGLQLALVGGSLGLIGLVWLSINAFAPGWPYHYFRLWMPPAAIGYWVFVTRLAKRRYGIDLQSRGPRLDRGERRAQRRLQRSAGTGVWRLARWVFGYILTPIMAFIAVAWYVSDLAPAWDVAHGGGVVGQFTYAHRDCSSWCTWVGSFEPDNDDTTEYVDVEMHDDVQGGDVATVHVRARYEDASGYAYAAQGSRAWIKSAVVTGCFALYVPISVIWIGIGLVRRRRRRTSVLRDHLVNPRAEPDDVAASTAAVLGLR